MDQETLTLIQDWIEADEKLLVAKANEIRLRKLLVAALFPKHKEEGSETFELPNPDYKINSMFGLNYKLDKDDEAIQNVFDRLGRFEDGEWIIENLFKRKLEIVPKIYNLLPPQYKAIVDEVITLQPSTPQVKFVAPKPDNKEKGLF
jgi:hypothetical protein